MLDDRSAVDAACRESVDLARRSGDPETIVRTIVRHLLNTAAWTSMAERRRLLAEAQAAAERTTSTETALDAAAAAIRVLAGWGAAYGAEQQVRRIAFGDRFARGSVTLRVDEPVLTLLALFRGDLDDARRRWSASVEDAVRRGGFAFVAPGSQAQALTLAREDGTVAGMAPFVESLLVGDDPLADLTTLRCVLALVQAEAGDVDASTATIDLVLGGDVETWAMAWGGNTIFSTCLLADAALLTGHRGAGVRLLPVLTASVADRNVVLGMPPVVALGWGTYFVGVCELLAGRPGAAVSLLTDAVARNTAMGARPATARAHLALAQALVEIGDGGGALRSATAAATIAAAGGYPAVERRARDLADRLDATPAAGGVDGGTTTFVFTDIVGSTAAAARLGDRAWRSVVEGVDSTVRAVTVRQGGRVVKALGDGWMLTFPSVRAGVGAAVELHAAVDGSVELRTGVHTGEAEAVGGDHIGHHVNLAARVSSAAAPGEILVSDVVRTIVGPGGDVAFGDARTVTLKGIEAPQRLHPVSTA
jgi:class 3 adenylate cyclase